MLRRHDVPMDAVIDLEPMVLVEPSTSLDPDVKVDRAPAKDPYVGGESGASWVGIHDVGARLYSITTGFEVNKPAVSYSWRVNVSNSYGFSRNHRWSGGLLYRTYWEGFRVDDVSRATSYTARASGFAIIYDTGLYCYSKGPSSRRVIN